MNGQLNEQPLVELIREIFSQSLEGVLRLSHGAVKVVIYFERGDIVYAAANVRELRFSEYLKKQELCSETELQSFRDKSDLALAASLRASNQIDLKTISKLLTQQVVDVLRVALLWREGRWEFDSRAHLEDSLRVKIDARNLLLQAARKMQPQVITERLPNQAEVLTQGSELTDAAALSPQEGYMLSRLANPDSLKNLIVSSGLPEADALRSIYGLALAGFAKRDRWPSVLKKDRPDVAPVAPVMVEETTEPTDVSVHTTADEVEDLLRRLDTATTYYDVLNLEPEATTEEIKNSYYSLARRYHPDLFHKQKGTPLHARVESAFAKIAQAYVTLADPKQRDSYNAKLAAREKVKRTSVEVPKTTQPDRLKADVPKKSNAQAVAQNALARAESNFQEGFLALQQGQTKAALVSLAAAARLAPDQARFRAYYGRALATTEATRRLAEAELQTALKLDPENSNYRLMLAELYFDLGFLRRAQAELKRVLKAEPSNPGGLKLMRRLETATT
jgi:tetratricopeptide (TPR) repeat protein